MCGRFVRNRIKVLDCSDFHDAEDKINNFLATCDTMEILVRIEWRLEYNIVIIEYIEFDFAKEVLAKAVKPVAYFNWFDPFGLFVGGQSAQPNR